MFEVSKLDAMIKFLNDEAAYLRKKLDRPGSESVIGTVRGVGYQLVPPP